MQANNGIITGSLMVGNKIKATQIEASTITGNLTGNVSGNVSGSSGSCTGNAATATKVGTNTVGGTAKPIYLNAGTPTAISSTVGSTSQPVYLNSGTITAITGTIGNSTTGNAATATKLANQRTVSLSGVVSGSGTFDGSANLSITTTGGGVTAVSTGSSNGTISVTTNGTASDVAVKGLGSAAYTASTAYATSSHNHDSTYLKLSGGTLTGALTGTTATFTSVTGAYWNDLADSIEVPKETDLESGYCYCTDGKNYYKSRKYLDEGFIGIHSDTYGFRMGKKPDVKQLDIGVAGFVLAHVDRKYKSGTPLTCTKDGYLTKMGLIGRIIHPERLVATFWKEENETTIEQEGRVISVDERCWVKVIH